MITSPFGESIETGVRVANNVVLSIFNARSMQMIGRVSLSSLLLVVVTTSSLAFASPEEACLNRLILQAGDELTLGELRARCRQESLPEAADVDKNTAIEERLISEAISVNNPWVITPHQPNYFMPFTYSSNVNQTPFEEVGDTQDKVEVKFQFSFKAPVVRNLFQDRAHLFFGYTNHSHWQLYDRDDSSPFRDTNHEPELFFVLNHGWTLGKWKSSILAFGLNHQSNGRPVPLSRSWNRIYGLVTLERDNWVLALKPWYRLPEDEKTDPLEADGDDNPDILDYMGYGEVRLLKKRGPELYNLMVRGNTSTGKGAIELSYSRALPGKARWYVQYFNGYGETLIDYNAHSNRIGFGIALSDWL